MSTSGSEFDVSTASSALTHPHVRNLGRAEIELAHSAEDDAQRSDITRAIADCVYWNEGRGLFDDAWERKVDDCLFPAYRLYLLILEEGPPALERLKAERVFAHRKRNFNRGNPALAVVMLAAKPKTPEHSKLCSDHASLLIWAADQGVTPSEFAARAGEITLRAAKEYVRAKRRATGSSTVSVQRRLTIALAGSNVAPICLLLSQENFEKAILLFATRREEVAVHFIKGLGELAESDAQEI